MLRRNYKMIKELTHVVDDVYVMPNGEKVRVLPLKGGMAEVVELAMDRIDAKESLEALSQNPEEFRQRFGVKADSGYTLSQPLKRTPTTEETKLLQGYGFLLPGKFSPEDTVFTYAISFFETFPLRKANR